VTLPIPGSGPTDPIASVLTGGLTDVIPFPTGSRYTGLVLAKIEVGDETVRYVTRRFVPSPDRFATIGEHVVTQGERTDTIAAALLGDPEQYWRLCDANNVARPDELAEVGRRVRMTLPEGLEGPPDA
jgi:hypothetical protein